MTYSSKGEEYGTILREKIISLVEDRRKRKLVLMALASISAILMSIYKEFAYAFILATRIIGAVFQVYRTVTYPV